MWLEYSFLQWWCFLNSSVLHASIHWTGYWIIAGPTLVLIWTQQSFPRCRPIGFGSCAMSTCAEPGLNLVKSDKGRAGSVDWDTTSKVLAKKTFIIFQEVIWRQRSHLLAQTVHQGQFLRTTGPVSLRSLPSATHRIDQCWESFWT